MEHSALIPHLFRTEFSRITAVLCKKFGIEYLEMAEDIASETFLLALETWSYKGVPENQKAWLHAVAKNKAINYLNRKNLFSAKIVPQLKHDASGTEEFDIDLSDQNITDSLLQMMFAICHPSISTESQIGLALRSLCGFGIDEIATAFLTGKETINKRLYRARERLRTEKVQINFPPEEEVQHRLKTVLITLYLLFNEGYYSESHESVLRRDFCEEAMRLTKMLIDHTQTNKPEVNALMALMCFHTSRFDARLNREGVLILYADQDELHWNREMIANGVYYLSQASRGNHLTKYHLEASIACWHTIKSDTKEKWEKILQLYEYLLELEYSPVAKLNSIYALSMVRGKHVAIIELEKLSIEKNQYYFVLLGHLYTGIDTGKARENFEKAAAITKTDAELTLIYRKINEL